MSQDYLTWTRALYLYFTTNAQSGAEIYLCVDSEILQDLGQRLFPEQDRPSYEKHFLTSVKDYCLSYGKFQTQRLYNKWLIHDEEIICPMGLGFLSALVLAAHRMVRDDDASEAAYFIRLREVLELNPGTSGRPDEIKTGETEPLWEQWNNWLGLKGFLATAEPGKASHKYTQYPISQALLRDGDKTRLLNEFSQQLKQSRLRRKWDQEHLAHWINRYSHKLSPKVQGILESPNTLRYQAMIESIYDVYLSMQKSNTGLLEHSLSGASKTGSRNMAAGLFRYEHPINETVSYYPYPRKPSRAILSDKIAVQNKEDVIPLQTERPGWFCPLEVKLNDLGKIHEWPILNDTGFKQLILPKESYWILVKDPENPESERWGTWRRPNPGEHFMLLCKSQHIDEMKRLRALKLLEWDEIFEVPELKGDWLEFEGCMITNLDWNGVFTQNSMLFDALFPHMQLGISLSGGLKSPQGNAWMASTPPTLTIKGVYTQIHIDVYQFIEQPDQKLDKVLILKDTVQTNSVTSLNIDRAGQYVIEAYHQGLNYRTRRNLKLVDWDELKPTPPGTDHKLFKSISSKVKMQGAWLEVNHV